MYRHSAHFFSLCLGDRFDFHSGSGFGFGFGFDIGPLARRFHFFSCGRWC